MLKGLQRGEGRLKQVLHYRGNRTEKKKDFTVSQFLTPSDWQLATRDWRLNCRIQYYRGILPHYNTTCSISAYRLVLFAEGGYIPMTSVAVPGLWCLLLGSDKWEI